MNGLNAIPIEQRELLSWLIVSIDLILLMILFFKNKHFMFTRKKSQKY